eukprot:6180706-Alexandrium_andersonii.AAC.1
MAFLLRLVRLSVRNREIAHTNTADHGGRRVRPAKADRHAEQKAACAIRRVGRARDGLRTPSTQGRKLEGHVVGRQTHVML